MTGDFTRRGFLAGLLSSAALPAFSGAPEQSLRPKLRGGKIAKAQARGAEEIISKANLAGRVMYAVADAKTGLLLEGRNLRDGTPPASVTKALTALYALDELGASHRFETRLLATGAVKDGIIKGDLVLGGYGDPTLDTDGLAEMAAALKKSGIRGVTGKFVIYQGALPFVQCIDPAQPNHVGYNPAVSGIALNFNRVHFQWKRAGADYAITMDARTAAVRPDVAMARMRVVDRKSPIYAYASSAAREDWSVARHALGKGGARWLPVRKPALYAGDVFATLARSHGIVLAKPTLAKTAPGGRLLVRRQSDRLQDILRGMLKYSTNLTAEMIGMSASKHRNPDIRTLRASAAEMNRWAKDRLGLLSPALVDHSGLGSTSKLTADDMVKALVKANANQTLRPILKPVALRDGDGRPNKDHSVKVDAKTGTLNFVSGLAGYMTGTDGTELVFAIFAADHETRGKLSKAEREAPKGAKGWNRRAKVMQQDLIERWDTLYGNHGETQ
ncbi:MAG: D-alanyl-D-alanine carboxypeptidase/D-alanyl-D-alanine-endopeptidase [Sulfitobacter sp.]